MKFAELKPKVVVGVAAHPDDLDFFAGGCMARWAGEGAAVYYLILTDGGKGSADAAMTSKQLTQLRRDEQRTAAQHLGLKDVLFLNYEDGALEVTQDLKRDIVRVIRQLKPEVVVTFDPSLLYNAERWLINHPDHRAAGQATLDAVYPLARDRLTFPELADENLEPHEVKTVLLMQAATPNHFVDISSTIDQKVAAWKAHGSQQSESRDMAALVREQASQGGVHSGVPFAEGFVRIDVQ